jgi:hypothetical protein
MTKHQPLRIIGLTGFAGTGKDTVREMLERDHDFCGFAFADPIRQMLRALMDENGIHSAYMDERRLKETTIPGLGVSYRYMAQTLGTEWGRNCMGPTFWTDIAAQHLAALRQSGGRLFVVSDVRFDNEAQWIKDAGGEIWRISRQAAEPVRAHASEAEIDRIRHDQWIHNDGTVEDLWCAVAALAHGVPA